MTAPTTTVRPAASAAGPDRPTSAPTGRARTARPAGPGLRVAGTALTILAVLLLGFVVDVGLLGDIRHDRDRQVDYATLRADLANGTAPVGPAAPGAAADAGPGVKPFTSGALLAVLSIPELHLREVVHEGTTSRILVRGPGHRRDTPLPGQAGVSVIMARQATYGGPFRHLGDLRPGQTFTVTTGQGTARYRVLGLRRGGDPQPAPLAAGAGRLTLITADGTAFMPHGILRVDADLVSAVQPASAPAVATAALPADEKPMAVEHDGWLPLVLWGQALVLAAAAMTWAHLRWGRPHTWVVGVPLLAVLGLLVADNVALLLPNSM
ncbi:sortase [Streptomyces sp. NPDC051976]|uniref:sortase domain-containing protein n=1 Tax=Streptomyces sp. NPDC051976 TaxID=3154947 RepID=UPI003448B2D1